MYYYTGTTCYAVHVRRSLRRGGAISRYSRVSADGEYTRAHAYVYIPGVGICRRRKGLKKTARRVRGGYSFVYLSPLARAQVTSVSEESSFLSCAHCTVVRVIYIYTPVSEFAIFRSRHWVCVYRYRVTFV